MSARKERSWFGHLIALGILSAIDAHKLARRLFRHTLLKAIALIAALMLVAIMISSLISVWQVARGVQSMTENALVGLESSVAMRAMARESQLEMLRVNPGLSSRFSRADIERFSRELRALLGTYRQSSQEAEVRARLIEERLAIYVASTEAITASARPDTDAIQAADSAARDLVNAVEEAYQSNRVKLRLIAEEARQSTARALGLAKILWVCLAVIVAGVLLVYAAYQWLALPEEGET